jgi:hypothetical protein
MPVKIKHKQLDKIEVIPYVNWISHYNHQLWDVIRIWDIGKIYNVQGTKPVYQTTVDKSAFLEAMKIPINQNALLFEPIPDVDNRPDLNTTDLKLLKFLKDNRHVYLTSLSIEGVDKAELARYCTGLADKGFVIIGKDEIFITNNGLEYLFKMELSNEVKQRGEEAKDAEWIRSYFELQSERRLNENLPKNMPAKVAKITKDRQTQKGTGFENIWKNDLIKYIGYPLIVGMLVIIILKIVGVL